MASDSGTTKEYDDGEEFSENDVHVCQVYPADCAAAASLAGRSYDSEAVRSITQEWIEKHMSLR